MTTQPKQPEPKHTYPSRHTPGTHWSTDEAWRILDRLPVGMLSDDWRFLVGGMIAGALMKARAAGRERPDPLADALRATGTPRKEESGE